MVEKIIIALFSVFVGVLISRILCFVEIHSLKDQLFEAEKDNEAIVRDNADLSRQNDILRKRIWELTKQDEEANIPKFGD